MRSNNKFHKQTGNLLQNTENMDLQNKGRRRQRGFSAYAAAWTLSQAQHLVFVVQTHLSKAGEVQAQNTLQEGCASIQALTQLERRPGILRGNIYGQSRAQQAALRQGHGPVTTRPVEKVSTSQTPKREGSTAPSPKYWTLDLVYRDSLRFENRTRRDCGMWEAVAVRTCSTRWRYHQGCLS